MIIRYHTIEDRIFYRALQFSDKRTGFEMD